MIKSSELHRISRPPKVCTAVNKDGTVAFESVLTKDAAQPCAVSTDYIIETTLRHVVILSDLLSISIEDVLKAVAPIFMCGAAERETLERYFNDPTFSAIGSSIQAAIYRRYVCSFCSNPNAYGKKPNELRVLEVKEKAFAFLDTLDDDCDSAMFDTVALLAKKQDSNVDSYGEYQLTYALVMYLQGKSKESVVTSLNGALKKGCVAAGLMLLYVEQDSDKRESIYARLQGIADFKLREGLADTVCSVYSIEPNNIQRNDFLGVTGGDNE